MVVVDAEVMRQFVHDCDHDLVGEHLEVLAHVAQWQSVQRDAIGQLEPAVVLAFGPRDALVEAEKVFVWMLVVDHQNDVVEQIDQAVGQRVDGIGHQILEGVHVDGLHDLSVPDPWPCQGCGWERRVDVE